ncbi:muconate-lactonizing protein (plasmid) [Mesorhizobium sp. 131-2-5]|uniref:mandelate racemase/muconate lactonizing enzyme family protein n=1 Tax=Mesorhizobium sp. 131-2-5 TaxID=2744519 RepID=UPI0018ED0B82|nr:mandelate racemase/muconate lactonizing enzyme family protein [Mesorhizobium sp. 131-2-5]BCH05389.1 muconate-lactonizing protein [Mesorhizobium sp. 131-2-5]
MNNVAASSKPRITTLKVYQIPLKCRGEKTRLSGGRTYPQVLSTIVEMTTESGLVGFGESVPWGSNYLPAYGQGVATGIAELGPVLIGKNPFLIGAINELMDRHLMGHPYVKTAIDMACWDLLGKQLNMPLHDLLGACNAQPPLLSDGIGNEIDAELDANIAHQRADGCRQFAAKASGDPDRDIAFLQGVATRLQPGETFKIDANGGWRLDEAIRVSRGTQNIDIVFEQPCRTYEECRDFSRSSCRPMILDECVDSLDILIRAKGDGILNGLNLKIGRHGGLTRARTIRDVCLALNVPMHIQDTGGSNIANAAIGHMAYSTPERVLLQVWNTMNLIETVTATGGAFVEKSRMYLTPGPGLAVEPDMKVLGAPISVFG